VAQNQPCVIYGARDSCDLELFKIDPAYLTQHAGDRTLPVLRTQSRFLSYERNILKMTVSEFTRLTFSDEDPGTATYYLKAPTKLLPKGMDDSERMEPLRFIFEEAVMRNIWVSRGEITVGAHFDAAENLNIQIAGRKRFTLFPPGLAGYYPFPMFSQTTTVSRVFRTGPELDRARFPDFDPARGVDVVLEEGEILYLPAYWWHMVTSLGAVNVNINAWSLPSVRKQIAHWNQALRGYILLFSRYLAFGDPTGAPPEEDGRVGDGLGQVVHQEQRR